MIQQTLANLITIIPDQNMKNGKRELSDCVEGSRRDWNHARKYLRLV
jgi:hypothetical protein